VHRTGAIGLISSTWSDPEPPVRLTVENVLDCGDHHLGTSGDQGRQARSTHFTVVMRTGFLNPVGAHGAMRRTVVVTILAVVVTILFVSGLAWMTRLGERSWSRNIVIREKQVRFAYAVMTSLTTIYVLNVLLNLRRSSGSTHRAHEETSMGTEPQRENPMRDRWLDG
jgi:hypothetical protein